MWNLYDNGKFLEPLKFSNKKTQEDIVREVLNEIEKGSRVIFIKGVCGTGKSAIALNIANNVGKSSVVVPGKNLQAQYKRDYEERKYVLKKDGSKLKISVITGRRNHKCKFLEENKLFEKSRKEINSNLDDIFDSSFEEKEDKKREDNSAERYDIPCKIEIKEKCWRKLKEYMKENKNCDHSKISDIKEVTRSSVAGVCPYWSPVLPEKYELKNFPDSKKKTYMGLNDTKFVYYKGTEGCSFYKQFESYFNSDVIVFNSLKYKLESGLNRKPQTEIEIIDECDEFLDSFSNQANVNIDRLQNSIVNQIGNFKEGSKKIIDETMEIINHLKKDKRVNDSIYSKQILSLRETGLYDLFKIFSKNSEIIEDIDEESYLFEFLEVVRMFDEYLNDSYLTFSKKEGSLIASVVSTNLAKKFQKMIDQNKVVVLMSGTIHSENVLRDIFGLTEFKIIEAETSNQGNIEVTRTGKESDCKYSNLSNGNVSRKNYLISLNECIKQSVKPTLVHVNAFLDLPNNKEKEEFDLDETMSTEELREEQQGESDERMVEDFKLGRKKVLFSTKATRGIDFPGNQCNSIVFTKYPNPNVSDAFWKVLMKTKPQHYWEFYRDKAERELLQKVYRGIRFKEDHVFILSPDSRVLDYFEKAFN
jgi:Rad3-related DNA helicase